jgi:hypothetical protein
MLCAHEELSCAGLSL